MVTDQEMAACRKIQQHLLDEFDAVCRKHNLIYWLDFGSLLGAARQKGFIPWDDDIDVSMPMAEYKKFLKNAAKDLPADIFVQTPQTDKFYRLKFTKLCDRHSTYLHPEETGNEPHHEGIYIDIFPSADYPKMPYRFRKLLLYVTGRSYAASVITRKNILLYPIYLLCKLVWLLFSPFKSNKVGQTVEDNWYYYAIPKSYIHPLGKIEFEGKYYPAPKMVHEYLSLMYGKNYITPPPPEKRVCRAAVIMPDTPCNYERLRTNKQ